MGLMTKWTIPDAPSPEAIVRAAWERAADRLLFSIPEDAHPESIFAFVLRDRAEIICALASNPAEVAAIIKKAAGEDRG
jgi:hypothetical protein